MFGLAVIALAACKKEQLETLVKPAEKQTGFNPDYHDIKPLILAFKQSAELSNFGTLKTSSLPDKTIEEAEWTLEGALNYDHAHPVQLYEGMHIDTLTITVSNNGNGETMVDGDDLAQAYANLLAAINNLVPTGEDVDVVDVEAVSHNNYFTTFKAYVNSGQPLMLQEDYVKPQDDWRAGGGTGKCDGTQSGLDATDRLDQIINFNYANNFYQNNVNAFNVLFYTSVESHSQYGYNSGPFDISKWFGQPNSPHDIYGSLGGTIYTCIDDHALGMYLVEVLATIESNRPLGKDVVRLNIGYTNGIGQPDPPCVHDIDELFYAVAVPI